MWSFPGDWGVLESLHVEEYEFRRRIRFLRERSMRGILSEVFVIVSLIFLDDIHVNISGVEVRVLGWRV